MDIHYPAVPGAWTVIIYDFWQIRSYKENAGTYGFREPGSECVSLSDTGDQRAVREEDISVYRQSKYINDWAGFPLYHNTSTKYYRCGEEMFPDMLAELEKAEHFIFLEYFIVDMGTMFDRIVEVLSEKAKRVWMSG